MDTLKEEFAELESDGRHWTLRYTLLAEYAEDRRRFGVSVCNETTGEETAVHDVLLYQRDGERLLAQLAAGGVTPVTLHEVVEDFIAENG